MKRNLFFLVLAIVVLLPVIGFAKDSAPTTTSKSLSGNWKLERVYKSSSDGSPVAVAREIAQVTIKQTGSKLRVIFLGVDSTLYDFTGSVTGNKVRLVYSGQGGFEEVLTGTVSADRKKVSGNLDVNWHEPGSNGKDLHHFGTFKFTK